MFRLIQLHPDLRTVSVYLDPDGYTNEVAAWAAYALAPGSYFGVGRFDAEGRLIQVVLDPACPEVDSAGPCGQAVTVAAAMGVYQPRCAACAPDVPIVTLDELALALLVPLRTAVISVRQRRRIRTTMVRMLAGRIREQLADRVAETEWRETICAALAGEPMAVEGLVDAVAALTDEQVLNLYPALRELAAALPAEIRERLQDSIGNPTATGGVTALRLGLTTRPHVNR